LAPRSPRSVRGAVASTPSWRSYECGSRRYAECPSEPAREMAEVRGRLPRGREMAEARREHAPAALAETPRERVPERGAASTGRREGELALAHAQQHLPVGSEGAEL